jgi:hypothetical protein
MISPEEKVDPLKFNGVKVFAATMAKDREQLGEKITEWIGNHRNLQVVDTVVTQSSDAAFHCFTMTLFYWENC